METTFEKWYPCDNLDTMYTMCGLGRKDILLFCCPMASTERNWKDSG